jgi:hypothetical protein
MHQNCLLAMSRLDKSGGKIENQQRKMSIKDAKQLVDRPQKSQKQVILTGHMNRIPCNAEVK